MRQYLLIQKRGEAARLIDRLDVGLSTLKKTAADVALLQRDLTQTMVRVEEKKAATEQLLKEMGTQRADAEVQRAAATVEAEKVGGWARDGCDVCMTVHVGVSVRLWPHARPISTHLTPSQANAASSEAAVLEAEASGACSSKSKQSTPWPLPPTYRLIYP